MKNEMIACECDVDTILEHETTEFREHLGVGITIPAFAISSVVYYFYGITRSTFEYKS